MKLRKDVRTLSLLLAIALIGAIFVPVVSAQVTTDNIRMDINTPTIAIGDCTNVLINDAKTLSDLKSSGIPDPEDLSISEGIARYDLVTFDHSSLNEQMQSTLSIQICGKDYNVILNRMNFESLDDGIDSYEGQIQGVEESAVLLTKGNNVLVGSIKLGNKTFWITPVEPRARAAKSQSPLHIIYSSDDVKHQEKPAIIDYGPISAPESYDSAVNPEQSIGSKIETTKQFYTANILVTTDNQFYQDETNWKAMAQDIIATANQQFGRDDIQVSLCVMAYDDSRRYQLSNHNDIMSSPLDAFKDVYPDSDLDMWSSDLGLYLGGYDKTGTEIGLSYGYTNNGRHSWAQMVTDWYDYCYWGTGHGRRCVSIHEIGHNFNAHHEGTSGYNQAYAFNIGGLTHTVMWSYFFEHLNCYEFSSDNYHGDATHDNARAIREAKAQVAGYV